MNSSDLYRHIGRFDPVLTAKMKSLMKSSLNNATFKSNSDFKFDSIENSSTTFTTTTTNKSREFSSYLEENTSKMSSIRPIRDSKSNSNKETLKSKSSVYAVLTEGRGYAEGEVGLASIDINIPTLYLSQFKDNLMHSGIITKLQILAPTELLVPQTIYDNGSAALKEINKNFNNIKIIPLPRRHFNGEDGLTMIRSLCSEDCKISISSYEKKYYALTAVSALFKYLKSIHATSFLSNSLKIVYQNRDLRMHIDHVTCLRLELLYSLVETKEKKSSLFGLLDNTVTMIGKRCLRSRILEPFFKVSDIESVQDCIKDLLENVELLMCLGEKLKIFCNIDKILKITIIPSETDCFKVVEQMLNDILNLKNYLENIIKLAEILKSCKSFELQKMHSNLTDPRLNSILELIKEIIRPEVIIIKGSSQCFQRIHAIRPEVNEYLDMIRLEYNKLTDEIHEIIGNLAEEHKLSFRMIYSISKGFHIQLQLTKLNSHDFQPPIGLNMISRKGNFIYFTTFKIDQINSRLTEVTKEAYTISAKIVQDLIENLMKFIDANYLLIETISNLDIIHSLAIVSQKDCYVCPKFCDEMRIVDAVHPLLEYSNSKPFAIPNNIIATPEYNFFVITGPNMGGKTVYIKTIAVLQVMAQLGCYVPAKHAKFRPCDKIFTRIGCEDNIENIHSSFTNEIHEMEYIFNNLTTNSLVIVDELCRSTNPSEGAELSWKICEKLCLMRGSASSMDLNEQNFKNSLKNKEISEKFENNCSISNDKNQKGFQLFKLATPFIFVTTHFIKLTKLKDIYFNVINLHLDAEEEIVNGNHTLKYNHKVKEGVTPIVGYGLSLARKNNFPENILTRAQELFDEIMFQEKSKPQDVLNRTTYSNKFVEDLEKSFSSESNKTFQRAQPPFNNNISKFMNSTENLNESISSERVSGTTIINDFKYQLYDLYADVAAILRQNPSDGDIRVKNVLENFKNSLPNEILAKLLNKKSSQANLSDKNEENVINLKKSDIVNKSNISSSDLNDHLNLNVSVQIHSPPRVIENILIKGPSDSIVINKNVESAENSETNEKLSKTLPSNPKKKIKKKINYSVRNEIFKAQLRRIRRSRLQKAKKNDDNSLPEFVKEIQADVSAAESAETI